MALAFDTLGYAKALRDGGLKSADAEALAEAARDYIMKEIATREDLRQALETQTLRLTVRMGAMMFAAAGIVIAALRYLPH